MPLPVEYQQNAATLRAPLMSPLPAEPTIAVAEDPFVRRYVRTLLTKHGFRTVESDPHLTRKLLESGELRPDILITNDPEMFAGFAAYLPVVYLAAAPDPKMVETFRFSRMVRKPFVAEQLLRAVSELVAAVP